MEPGRMLFTPVLVLGLALATPAAAESSEVCEGFGPETPRDIDARTGENRRVFALAPDRSQMILCNIHFHVDAEHKAKDFSIYAGEGENGVGGVYRCQSGESLTEKELRAPAAFAQT